LKKYSIYNICGISFSLVSLFFYPLSQSLSGKGQYYLSWKLINTYEYIAAFTILFFISIFLILQIEKIKSKNFQLISFIFISFLPFAFFIIHFLRQFVGVPSVKYLSQFIYSFNGFVIILIIIFLAAFFKKIWINFLYDLLKKILLILLPLSFFTNSFIIIYGLNGHIDNTGLIKNFEKNYTIQQKNNIYIFLFDELDFSILYDGGESVDKKFKNIKKLSDKSINYLNARAPGDATLSSITQLLIGKKIQGIHVCGANLCHYDNGESQLLDTSKNIFKLAQNNQYKTALIAWVHKYCTQYGTNLDFCRSYSLYNYSSFQDGFSIFNPFYTNIILLPHQFPFGFLKNPVYSKMHHRNNLRVQNISKKIIEYTASTRVLLFAHYSLPHVPYVYEIDKFQPSLNPFEENVEKYVMQLEYVDKMIGELIEKIRNEKKLEESTIILLSDHGLRHTLDNSEFNHVPMIVYKGNNPIYKKVNNKVQTEEVIKSIIEKN
jgi:hypothetical protein